MNTEHYPAGTEKGGQFAPKLGGIMSINFSQTELMEKYGITEDIIKRQEKIDEVESEESVKPSVNSYDKNIQDATNLVINKAIHAEPEITRDITSLAKITGGELKGLEHVLKTPESIADKIYGNLNVWHNTMEQAIDYVDDSIRYTMTFDDDLLADGVDNILRTLMDNGYEIRYMQNRYLPSKDTGEVPVGYKDIGCKIIAPNGVKFEIQFSTKEAYTKKNDNPETGKKGSHYYYKIENSLLKKQNRTPEEEERLNYARYMNEYINGDLKPPKNIEKIKREEYRR